MSGETVLLTREMFDKVHRVLHVAVPEDVIAYYTDDARIKNDFTATIIDISEKGLVPELVVQITAAFAKQIIVQFQRLHAEEKTLLEEEIRNLDAKSFNWFTSTLSYLLIDGVRKYDAVTNTFRISVIDAAYKKLHSNTDEMILILSAWMHCGGWGGLILRGPHAGYDGGGSHDQFLEVEYEGEQYAYSSNCFADKESHHLDKT